VLRGGGPRRAEKPSQVPDILLQSPAEMGTDQSESEREAADPRRGTGRIQQALQANMEKQLATLLRERDDRVRRETEFFMTELNFEACQRVQQKIHAQYEDTLRRVRQRWEDKIRETTAALADADSLADACSVGQSWVDESASKRSIDDSWAGTRSRLLRPAGPRRPGLTRSSPERSCERTWRTRPLHRSHRMTARPAPAGVLSDAPLPRGRESKRWRRGDPAVWSESVRLCPSSQRPRAEPKPEARTRHTPQAESDAGTQQDEPALEPLSAVRRGGAAQECLPRAAGCGARGAWMVEHAAFESLHWLVPDGWLALRTPFVEEPLGEPWFPPPPSLLLPLPVSLPYTHSLPPYQVLPRAHGPGVVARAAARPRLPPRGRGRGAGALRRGAAVRAGRGALLVRGGAGVARRGA